MTGKVVAAPAWRPRGELPVVCQSGSPDRRREARCSSQYGERGGYDKHLKQHRNRIRDDLPNPDTQGLQYLFYTIAYRPLATSRFLSEIKYLFLLSQSAAALDLHHLIVQRPYGFRIFRNKIVHILVFTNSTPRYSIEHLPTYSQFAKLRR